MGVSFVLAPRVRARIAEAYKLPGRRLGSRPIVNEIDAVLEDLLAATDASRVTLRQDLPGDYDFGVTNEALAPGVSSLRDERSVDLRTQPVVLELKKGRQVVQDDCRTAFSDPAFHRMLEAYGGLAAQIVTPVFHDRQLVAIVSLHQLGSPRHWTAQDVATASRAAERVGELL
jgi:GAF domain-containing protein